MASERKQYEPKPEKHPLVKINDLLTKAWEIADTSMETAVPKYVINSINKALSEVSTAREWRGV